MTHAYTPGLKVKAFTLLRKTRRLPTPGEVLVQEGDTVSCDTIVAKTTLPGEIQIVNVASALEITPEETERCMLKKIGETVEKDETIALVRSFFGLFKKFCRSPMRGTIELISNTTGQVAIRGTPIPVQVKAYITGKVVKVLPREGVVIETPASYIQGIFGIGGETYGELMIIPAPNETVTADMITPECSGRILVGGALVTPDALNKAMKEGVKGMVVGGIDRKDLCTFIGYDIGVAITGEENVGLTLIITEGFGKMKMSDRIFKLLESSNGKLASINGKTQIRAGVIRPEIIVPHGFESIDRDMPIKVDDVSYGMTVGTPVRITREPHFGKIGHIASLPVELQRIETESKVRVAVVKLENGIFVTVPRANIEIIE